MLTARALPKVDVHPFRSGEAIPQPVEAIGEKAFHLMEACRLGLSVPPGFVLPVGLCRAFHGAGERLPADAMERVREGVAALEAATGRRFGDPEAPLLLSVRSGASVSMPGMLDSLLNIGLTPDVFDAWKAREPGVALDCQARLLAQVGEVVHRFPADPDTGQTPFDEARYAIERERSGALEPKGELVARYRELLADHPWPDAAWEQLEVALVAVLRSWNNERARGYRRQHGIDGALGTAVTIQAMVLGNRDERSATGVALTRDPSTGERRFCGEYLVEAQGEDVVSGARTPIALDSRAEPFAARFPDAHAQLEQMRQTLERHFRDLLELEFTVESGQLWLLQIKRAQRSPAAAFRVAVDMVDEGLLREHEALLRVSTDDVEDLLEPRLDPDSDLEAVARGLPACPGAASGKVVFTAREAQRLGPHEPVILVRVETSPEDVAAMKVAAGVLTARGGMTSHAAVVARGLGRPCVVGCAALSIDPIKKTLRIAGEHDVAEGDVLTIDGATGDVLIGQMQTVRRAASEAFDRLMSWADRHRRLQVRANADTVDDAEVARRLGAEGVGLCRTEGMFREPERRRALQAMLLADSEVGRIAALKRIEPLQRADFLRLFEAMPGLPVVIRLLDPSAAAWRPRDEAELEEVASMLGHAPDAVRDKIERLADKNPVIGLRGSRLGVAYPELYETQTRAALSAAVEARRRGIDVRPELMLPLITSARELAYLRKRLVDVAESSFAAAEANVDFRIGTMIEVPRAALRAGELAQSADFFSFGTNDLTQLTYGISRDDVKSIIPKYLDLGLMPADPFAVLDEDGVGALMELAVQRGRATRGGLIFGITGRHAGDARSIRFSHRIGLDYVSCAPHQVPQARLAAAQAAILEGRGA